MVNTFNNKALKNLVFDSLEELKSFVCRIELRSFGESKKLVIVFFNFFALKQWEAKEAFFLARMRKLYKERGLKEVIIFHQVIAEAQGQRRFYKEKSSGDFEVLSSSETLNAIFTRIKIAIKENLEKERI